MPLPRPGGWIAAIRQNRVAPFLLMGPISGPFVAGVVLNFRDGRPVLGSLYAVALSLWLGLGPALLTKVL